MEISIYNRDKNCSERELVYGEKSLQWFYGSKIGQFLGKFAPLKLTSKVYGSYQDLAISRKKICSFVKNFHINMDEFIPEDGKSKNAADFGHSSFNSFFIRRFRPGARSFNPTPLIFHAPVRPAMSE